MTTAELLHLAENGYVKASARFREGRRKGTKYRLNLPVADCDNVNEGDTSGGANVSVVDSSNLQYVPESSVTEEDNGVSKKVNIPDDLKGLALYEVDSKLCAAWPAFKAAAQATYPDLDIVQATREAHLWEVANPDKQKVRRTAFLSNWFKRATRMKTEQTSLSEDVDAWRNGWGLEQASQ